MTDYDLNLTSPAAKRSSFSARRRAALRDLVSDYLETSRESDKSSATSGAHRARKVVVWRRDGRSQTETWRALTVE